MNIKTVTTFNKRLHDEYAHRFMSTYNWPFELIVYSEDEIPNVETFNTFDLIPKCKEFVDRNINREVPSLNLDTFKYDAVRFCYKVYVYTHEILKQIEDRTDDVQKYIKHPKYSTIEKWSNINKIFFIIHTFTIFFAIYTFYRVLTGNIF